MRFWNARDAIHSAYSIDMMTPDRISMGTGTKFDSTGQVFSHMKAGLIIAAVDKLPEHVKHLAMYCFAPDDPAYQSERTLEIVWEKLQEVFWEKSKGTSLTPRDRSKIPTLAKRVIQNFKFHQNTKNDLFTKQELAASMGRSPESFNAKYKSSWNTMEQILIGFIKTALRPVAKIVNQQRDRIKDDRIEAIQKYLVRERISEGLAIKFLNNRCVTNHKNLQGLSNYEADMLENEIEQLVALRTKRLRKPGTRGTAFLTEVSKLDD